MFVEAELHAEAFEAEEEVERIVAARVRQPGCSTRGGVAPARRRPAGAAAAARRHAEAQHAGDDVLQLAPIDDDVEHAVLEQELAALEALGQLLPDRLLDDARAGEADERLRLGDVEVAQHREARGHAAGRRIGQDRDVGQPRAIEARERGADLRHLHQRQRAFHHPRAARAGHDDDRQRAARWRARSPRVIFSPTTTPMLPPMNLYSIAATTRLDAVDASRSRVMTASFRPVEAIAGLEPLAVGLGVGERAADRSTRSPRRAPPTSPSNSDAQPLGRADSRKWCAHFGADAEARREVLVVDDLRRTTGT